MFIISTDESYLLRNQTLLAISLYYNLCSYIDSNGVCDINYKRLIKDLSISPVRGRKGFKPSKGELRIALSQLEQIGLIERDNTGRCKLTYNKNYSTEQVPNYSTVFKRVKANNFNVYRYILNKNYSTGKEVRLALPIDWIPDSKILENMNVKSVIPIEIIRDFRNFWSKRTEILKSDKNWHIALVRWFNDKTNTSTKC